MGPDRRALQGEWQKWKKEDEKRRPTRYGCMIYDLDAFSESVVVSRSEVVFLAF